MLPMNFGNTVFSIWMSDYGVPFRVATYYVVKFLGVYIRIFSVINLRVSIYSVLQYFILLCDYYYYLLA
jgi:hypothetical protein